MRPVAAWTATASIVTALGSCATPGATPAVKIRYLGHAAFLLEFPTGLTVLTDYGESGAYGLDSPVYGLGAIRPDVVTRSHDHVDHAGGELPEGVGVVLTAGDGLEEKGVRVTSIPTYEATLEAPDNASFLVEYEGLKILHLGDCQALIVNVGDPDTREKVRSLYPDTYDVVFLPIGFVRDIVAEASEFVTLINARRVIPMHYWTPDDRQTFLERMSDRTDGQGRKYRAAVSAEAECRLEVGVAAEGPVEVLGLNPAPVPLPPGAYLGQSPPHGGPDLFAPGIVSTRNWEHSSPAFSPAGDLVLWTEIADQPRIRMSVLQDGLWCPALVAPWSGTYSDFYSTTSGNGLKVFFSSYRPWRDGVENPGWGITIWSVDRTDEGWAEPVRLGEPIATGNEFGFSLDSAGTLYFTRAVGDAFRIFRAEPTPGGFGDPVPLPPDVNGSRHQDGPFITPDGRVLLFESIRPDGSDNADLYVSVTDAAGRWSPAVSLGPSVNTPAAERFARLSPDGRYLFFGSDRTGDRGDIFWVAVEDVEPLRQALER